MNVVDGIAMPFESIHDVFGEYSHMACEAVGDVVGALHDIIVHVASAKALDNGDGMSLVMVLGDISAIPKNAHEVVFVIAMSNVKKASEGVESVDGEPMPCSENGG